VFDLQTFNGETIASIFHFGVLFGEFSPFVNLALGGLVCLPNFIHLKYNITPELPK